MKEKICQLLALCDGARTFDFVCAAFTGSPRGELAEAIVQLCQEGVVFCDERGIGLVASAEPDKGQTDDEPEVLVNASDAPETDAQLDAEPAEKPQVLQQQEQIKAISPAVVAYATSISKPTVDDKPGLFSKVPVSALGISEAIISHLLRAGIETVAQLRATSDDELLAMDGFGLVKLERVRTACEELGERLDSGIAPDELPGVGGAVGNGVIYNEPVSIDEWLSGMSETRAEAMSVRFNGGTLQEAGNAIGVTRERVRQIQGSELKRRPPLKADAYRHLVDTYRLTPEEFCLLTAGTVQGYHYLTITSDTSKDERRPFSECYADERLDEAVKRAAEGHVIGNALHIDGCPIEVSMHGIVEYLAKSMVEPVGVEVLMQRYNAFLSEHGLEGDKRLEIKSLRAFDAWLLRNDHVLLAPHPDSEGGNTVRRYESAHYDYCDLVEFLTSEPYENVEISTAKIFVDPRVQQILQSLDLRDGYELHAAIRKYCPKMDRVEIGRTPMITFGEGDRELQVMNLIKEIGPVDDETLATEYQNRYGVSKPTFKGTFLKSFVAYCKNGLYSCSGVALDDAQVAYLKEKLSKPCYTISEVGDTLAERFPSADVTRVSIDAPRFGYTVPEHLLVKEGADIRPVFAEMIRVHDRFALGERGFEKEVFTNSGFRAELEIARRAYGVVEYDKDAYVNTRVLEQGEDPITVARMEAFVGHVLETAQPGVPFSVKSLLASGFEDSLVESARRAGYGHVFFQSLIGLLTVGSRLKKTSINGTDVFCKVSGWFATPDLVEYIVGQKDAPLTLDELREQLDSAYGIEVEKSVLRYSVRRASLAYDEATDSVRALGSAD